MSSTRCKYICNCVDYLKARVFFRSGEVACFKCRLPVKTRTDRRKGVDRREKIRHEGLFDRRLFGRYRRWG